MSSVVTDFRHSSPEGYFITTGSGTIGYYISTAASGSGGSFVPPVMTPLVTTSSAQPGTFLAAAAGVILRDLGKTITVGGLATSANTATAAGTAGVPTRVFRKVQVINHPAGVVGSAANVANGVGGLGVDNTNTGMYQSFYIELPTLGRGGHTGNIIGQPVAYIPALPGLYV